MMSFESVGFTEREPNIGKMKNFLQHMWVRNRFITQEIRDHRNLFKPEVEEYMKSLFSSDRYFAMPLGSFWTLPTLGESDHDASIVVEGYSSVNDDLPTTIRSFQSLNKSNKVTILESWETENIRKWFNWGSERAKDDNDFWIIESSRLLFLPDIYIAGNVEMARTIRMELLAYIRDKTRVDKYWDRVLYSFREDTLLWQRNKEGHAKQLSRSERFKLAKNQIKHWFSQKIQEGELQIVWERWEESFKKWFEGVERRGTSLPSFYDVEAYLKSSNGAINI